MTYPRRCPLCEGDYRGPPRSRPTLGVLHGVRHATLSAEPGGTPSPQYPGLPGRLLMLRCRICRGGYARDYFGGRRAGGVVRGGRYRDG